jgi:uncharacterized protein
MRFHLIAICVLSILATGFDLKKLYAQNKSTAELTIIDAIKRGDVSTVNKLLSKGIAAELKAKTNDNPLRIEKPSLLMIAAMYGQLTIVNTLLEHGAKVSNTSEDKTTPLMCAAANGNIHVMQKLISAGGKIEAKNKLQETALMLAARFGQREASQLLLEKGASINAERVIKLDQTSEESNYKKHYGINAFTESLMGGHVELARFLLEKGANPVYPGKDDPIINTLKYVAANGHIGLVQPLLARGVKINDTGSDGSTALMEAVRNGQVRMAEYLIAYGANVNFKDKEGCTALLVAAKAQS